MADFLSSFVPAAVLRDLAAHGPLSATRSEAFDGAVLLADLSGFSKLASELAETVDGVERLTEILNGAFERLIEVVHRLGGDVIKFAGDALIVLWRSDEKQSLDACALLALMCAIDASHAIEMSQYEGTRQAGASDQLSGLGSLASQRALPPVASGGGIAIHCAVAVGRVYGAFVGGVSNRWEYLLAGTAVMHSLASALEVSGAGEIVVTQSVKDLLGDAVHLAPQSPGPGLHRFLYLTGSKSQPTPSPLARPTIDPYALAPFVPTVVLSRIDAGQSEWISEKRFVSVLFLSLPLVFEDPKTALEPLQKAVVTIQDTLSRLEGTLRQVIFDDKGFVCIVAFGLPPLCHDDDPLRAVMAAMRFVDSFKGLASVGVASGKMYCGAVGSAQRREFAVVSSSVNLSARLMARAPRGSVLCDEATQLAASRGGRLMFEAQSTANDVKGFKGPVRVYAPLGLGGTASGSGSDSSPGTPRRAPSLSMTSAGLCVGREKEKSTIMTAIKTFASPAPMLGGRSGGIAIVGEAGLGKSLILFEILKESHAFDVTLIDESGDPFENTTPYHVIKPILSQLVNFDAFDSPLERRAFVESLLSKAMLTLPGRSNAGLSRPTTPGSHKAPSRLSGGLGVSNAYDPSRLRRSAPLLNDLLDFGFQETPFSKSLQGQARSEAISIMVVHIAMAATSGLNKPVLLVVDDAQWVDNTSWGIIAKIARNATRVLVVGAARPTRSLDLGAFKLLKLDVLPPAEISQLVKKLLGATGQVPPEIDRLVVDKANGHPFFAAEMVHFLRDDAKVVVCERGRVSIAPDADLGALKLPNTIEGLVMQRLGELTPRAQLMLKVASVIGRQFAEDTLTAVYPIEADKKVLHGLLGEATRSDLLLPETSQYVFKQIVIHEVSYELLLAEQRRNLHRAVAEHYERGEKADSPLLAFHLLRCDEPARAVPYLEQAGEQARRQYANLEAIEFFFKALELVESSPELQAKHPATVRARWHYIIGECYMFTGRGVKSAEHLQMALKLFGNPFPRFVLWRLAREFRVQRKNFHRKIYLEERKSLAEAENQLVLQHAEAYERMSQITYFRGDTLGSVMTLIAALNLAERANSADNEIVVRLYISVGLAMFFAKKNDDADEYLRRGWHLVDSYDKPMRSIPSLCLVTGITHCALGRLQKGHEYLERGAEAAVELGESRRFEENAATLSDVITLLGYTGVDVYQAVYESSLQRGDRQSAGWAASGLLFRGLRFGDEAFEDSENRCSDLAKELLAVKEDLGDRIEKLDHIWIVGALSLYHSDLAMAREAIALMRNFAPTAFNIALTGATPVFVLLRELAKLDKGGRRAMVGEVRRAIKAFKPHADVFVLCKPVLLRAQAYLLLFEGKRTAAITKFRECQSVASSLDMAWEALAAQFEAHRLDGAGESDDMDEAARDLGISLGRMREEAVIW